MDMPDISYTLRTDFLSMSNRILVGTRARVSDTRGRVKAV